MHHKLCTCFNPLRPNSILIPLQQAVRICAFKIHKTFEFDQEFLLYLIADFQEFIKAENTIQKNWCLNIKRIVMDALCERVKVS